MLEELAAVKSRMAARFHDSPQSKRRSNQPIPKWIWSALAMVGLSCLAGCHGVSVPFTNSISSLLVRRAGAAIASQNVDRTGGKTKSASGRNDGPIVTDTSARNRSAERKSTVGSQRGELRQPDGPGLIANSGLSKPIESELSGEDEDTNPIEVVVFRQPESGGNRQSDADADPSKIDSDFTQSLRLTFPPEIPGANVPRLSLPATQGGDDPKLAAAKQAAIEELFPATPEPSTFVVKTDRVMTLAELEQLALENSPIITQALASITVSQGAAFQAGVYPNPVFGYEADTVGSSFTRNYQGVYLSQLVKTANKLPLQRAAANMELMNSQLAYERTQLEVLRLVRAGYYNVLVSQEATRINGGVVRFTNRVLEIMKNRLEGGRQAPYEVSQMRSLVKQAYTTKVQSENRYVSAWKQLAVAVGLPELAPTTLEGRVDQSVPNHDFDALLERVLMVHPDLVASKNLESQSRYELQYQQAVPIPDVTVAGALQNDFTTPGYQRTSYNVNVSVPVPLFDQNKGNIRSAQGRLKSSSQQYAVTKNQLTVELADAFERFQTSRVQAEYYRMQILPDLAQAYLGVYDRHRSGSQGVDFGDIIVAQQNMAAGVAAYIGSLSMQWIALTDIANLMQLRNFDEILHELPNGIPSESEVLPAPTQEGGRP